MELSPRTDCSREMQQMVGEPNSKERREDAEYDVSTSQLFASRRDDMNDPGSGPKHESV